MASGHWNINYAQVGSTDIQGSGQRSKTIYIYWFKLKQLKIIDSWCVPITRVTHSPILHYLGRANSVQLKLGKGILEIDSN
jgi:hypothetical protein